MDSIAFVEKIENGVVTVSVVRKGACGENCGMCHACTAQKVTSKAYSDIPVKVGDTVKVESDTRYVLAAMSVVFVLPFFLALLLYLLFMNVNELLSYAAFAVGLAVSFGFAVFLSRSNRFIKKMLPKIVAIINKK